LPVRQCTYRIRADDAATSENFLKLGGRFGILVGGHEGLAANVGRVQAAQIESHVEPIHSRFVVKSGLQSLHTLPGSAAVQRGYGAKNGQVREADEGTLGEALVEIIGQYLGSRGIAREAERKSRGVFDVAAVRQREGCGGFRSRLFGVPVQALPYRCSRLIGRRRFTSSLREGQIHRPAG
jgi:hypothetical protein